MRSDLLLSTCKAPLEKIRVRLFFYFKSEIPSSLPRQRKPLHVHVRLSLEIEREREKFYNAYSDCKFYIQSNFEPAG